MADKVHLGPLHLQRHLTEGTDAIAKVLCSSVDHPVSLVRDVTCHCSSTTAIPPERQSQVHRTPPAHATGETEKRTSAVRRQSIESSRTQQPGSAVSAGAADAKETHQDARRACRFFSLQMNDEEGVVHAFCRRCNRRILVYDRTLYWGVKREGGSTPPTYPYKCSCGGHTFEVTLGFTYLDDALDENDLDTISVAVRCASCNEVAVVFDDEAT